VSSRPDQLYELLPAVHRLRDAEQGYPLRALLQVISEQVNVIEDDIAQLYDNWFIETCEDWVVPYIGNLIGYRPLQDASVVGNEPAGPATQKRNRILIPRKDVASTLSSRRRKGTLALLELLVNNVAGWPARAVEFYTLLGWTQHLNHRQLSRGKTVDLHNGNNLDLIDGPFEQFAHTVDVRRITSHHSPGRYNIPTVGLFVWRLKTYSVTHAPANCVEGIGPQCFTFNVLGNDTQLYAEPQFNTEPTNIAEEVNLPVPIRRRALEERISLRPLATKASSDYYGAGKSIAIYAPDWPEKDKGKVQGERQPVSPELVIPADLSDWRYRARRRLVAVDPVLGRIVFPVGQLPKRGVWVSYRYAFSADIGGGEYNRNLTEPVDFTLYKVTKDRAGSGTVETINAALEKWRQEQDARGPEPADDSKKEEWRKSSEKLRAAVIEIEDSSVYNEPLTIALKQGESLQIRAANRARPVLRLPDNASEGMDSFTISGKKASRFKLDGLTVTGRGLRINGPDRADPEAFAEGDLCDVTIRHSTLVPGWSLEHDCEPRRPNEASIEIFNTDCEVVVEASVIGSIYVTADEVQADPVLILIRDSIVDATSEERVAIGAPNLPLAFANLSIARTTVIGRVNTHALMKAEDSIFMSAVRVGRRQKGCLRFCYVPSDSRTPQRYHCQPDLAIAALDEITPPLPAGEKSRVKEREIQRVRPGFESSTYGTPAYCQLSADCAEEISRGAEDESEMGVFHDLFNPQRTANLRARLAEYAPAGMEADILFEN